MKTPELVDPNTPPFKAPFLTKVDWSIDSFAKEELSTQMTPPFPKEKFSSKWEFEIVTSASELIVKTELSSPSFYFKVMLSICTFKGRIFERAWLNGFNKIPNPLEFDILTFLIWIGLNVWT